MDSLTNPPGVTEYEYNTKPHTLHTLSSMFEVMLAGGANPWLQVEQYMSEEELLGFVEYIAAPYNPAKDSPLLKPWAAKRYAQGQPAPWTDMFEKFMYRPPISNKKA